MARNDAWLDAQDDLAYERSLINVARASFGTPVTLIPVITGAHTAHTVSDVVVSREEEAGGATESWSANADRPWWTDPTTLAAHDLAEDDWDEPFAAACSFCGIEHPFDLPGHEVWVD